MSDERLIDIESRIAWQEAAIQELSAVVSRQQQELDRLRALCTDLQTRLAESASEGGRPLPQHEPPPHY